MNKRQVFGLLVLAGFGLAAYGEHSNAVQSAAEDHACMLQHANDGKDYLCSDAAFIAKLNADCVDDFRKAGQVTDPHYCTETGYRSDRMGPTPSTSSQSLDSTVADLHYLADAQSHIEEAKRLRANGDFDGAAMQDDEANRMLDKMDERDMLRGHQ